MTIVARVALSVFRESVRDRVLYSLVLFAVLLIGTSYAIGQLTAGQDIKIIKDLGLAAISVFGLLMAVFIGIGLVWKEVERRSIYNLLSKPLRRHEFILGKYFGLVLTLAVNVAAMTIAYFAVLAYLGGADPALLTAVGLILLELSLVTAVALFFSTFSTPYLSAVLTFGLWVIGTFNEDLRNFEAVVASREAAWLTRGLYYVLPNFGGFDVKAQVVHGLAVPWPYVATMSAYGVVYIALLLVASIVIFARRDFR
jgi:ABC-type transport system involved in multi-copper enzyme maturation permease subunit